MSIQSRLRTIEKAARERTRPSVLAVQWACLEPPELRDKFRCPEFEPGYIPGPDTEHYPVLIWPPEWYHWTLEELKAEAERRGVELMLIETYDYGAKYGQPRGARSDAQDD